MADGQYVGRRLDRQARFTTFCNETSHCRKMTAAAMLDSTKGYPNAGAPTGFEKTTCAMGERFYEREKGK